ncbi:transcription antitermination factor NusB [Ornithinibacillus halotolerans]|uniref:Transcription antitermination protein NusB n=1 Tax=Ornithinibacillus halotolerans TaxID=1274357 RepID=A0A916RTD1_9BACI|nr:transcription antitermination factor NusB [Ornithinibacillus halotolerans]GGA68063.1 N utilization substance protein B [Ornithinibacillus halotolerans]
MKRHEAREKAFQTLFQLDLIDEDIEETIQERLEEVEKDQFLQELVTGVVEKRQEIDEIISANLEKWSFNRLAAVEKAVLRIATYEIKHMEDIPENVSINEAVTLAKLYGDDKSGKFVNGVLSKIIKD